MRKNVVIISTSLRSKSNSEILARECERGAIEAGHDVKYISLKEKDVKFCVGCMSCSNSEECIINDDVNSIMKKVREADVIVYATPIYYYEMSGQMKTLLDRMNPLYHLKPNFRDVYLLATAADDEKETFDKAYNGLQGWVDCFDDVSIKGIVKAYGVDNPSDVVKHDDVMQKAYELGKNV